jgi:hypothetical protein
MSERSRLPWSDDDLNTLGDMVEDGYPRRAIASRLGRSIHAVQGMARKLGLRLLRAATVAFQCQIDAEVFADLARIARERYVTPTTLARIIIELAVRSPVWLARLFDDADDDRRGIASTSAHEHQPACLSAAAVPISRPLQCLTRPELDGRMTPGPVLVALMPYG